MIDTTGSMGSYIKEAKNTIRLIIKNTKLIFGDLKISQEKIRFAIISYKDHCDPVVSQVF